jgi:hypothetical protein
VKRRLIRALDVLEDWMAVFGDDRTWMAIGMAIPAVVLFLIS